MKRTKIVATIGPASQKVGTLKEMVHEGMNVCRLNFSHGDHAWHKMAIARIRKIEKQMKTKIGIMADIQGPRVRIANHKNVTLKKSDKVYLTDNRSPHNHNFKKEIMLDWNGFYEHLKKRDLIFIEDGLIQLQVERRTKTGCVAKVLVEGTVKPHKGVNIPAISHHLGFLTDKDMVDLDFILSQNVDFIAVSFVATKGDLLNLRRIIDHFIERRASGKKKGKQPVSPWVVSKVERKKAMKNIKDIIAHSDALMIARGDLAIETPQQKVAIHQKDIISKCLKAKKPTIVATQMMTSMIENTRPTRAEISDVTNAVIDNADAVMLSNESAMGKQPVEVVKTMTEIIKTAEESPYNDIKLKKYGKFAKLLSPGRKSGKRKKSVHIDSLKTAVDLSSFRQENISISVKSKNKAEDRKGTLVWGVS